MTPTEIEQIRARHQPEQLNNGEEVMAFCRFCKDKWPCDASLLLAALSEAEAEREDYAKFYRYWRDRAEAAEAEVASLTAIRERAEQVIADPDVVPINAAASWRTETARFILGAAPSPEPPMMSASNTFKMPDPYEEGRRRRGLREYAERVANDPVVQERIRKAREGGPSIPVDEAVERLRGAAPSPEPPPSVDEYGHKTAGRGAAPAPKEERSSDE